MRRNISICMIALFGFFFILVGIAAGVCLPTQTDIEGPYYLPDAPFRTEIAGQRETGETLIIQGEVFDTNCIKPLQGVLIEVWQTDIQGKYHYQDEHYRLRGQMRTDVQGKFSFSSIMPGRYSILSGYRPAHIHFRVSHPGYRVLVTQLYFKGDSYLWPNDACGKSCRSNDPLRIIELQKKKKEEREVLHGTFKMVLESLH